MKTSAHPPWATGPGEILRHGLSLLSQDSDVNRRLAMISIDNSVELMVKTYLGLPRRITGLQITRREYEEFSQSFPRLLDALESHAAEKLDGINLGEIEWYHRLRNELYHQGNGLTVERDKVEVYSELANLLFANLFGFRLIEPEGDRNRLLGDFMERWIAFERVVVVKGDRPYRMPWDAVRRLAEDEIISSSELSELQEIRKIRNEVVHGVADHNSVVTQQLVDRLDELTNKIARIMESGYE